MVGRKPLPEGQALTEKLYTKVTVKTLKDFASKCQHHGITPAEGLRRAVALWNKTPGAHP